MTIAVDFDGVIHSYENGWMDGSIYGELVEGASSSLVLLMTHQPVFIHTSRNPGEVMLWLIEKTNIPCTTIMPPFSKFWNELGVLLITNKKLPAIAYIDDRGIRFENWAQTLDDLERFTK